ncbi:MAG: SpoIIE family protein phosphatase [Clostridia bacterium]
MGDASGKYLRNRVEVAVRKAPKAGVSTSGDSMDVVERPRGGLSVVMSDAQGSGPAAKRMSNLVIAKAMSLIAEGVRDGAVARAVHDNLFALRGGKVLCTLTIMSVDLWTDTLVISRNGNAGALLGREGKIESMLDDVPPIGVHNFTRPSIAEVPLAPGIWGVMFTDGVGKALERLGGPASLTAQFAPDPTSGDPETEHMADGLFDRALEAYSGRPGDDMSLAVVGIGSRESRLGEVAIRSIDIQFPF